MREIVWILRFDYYDIRLNLDPEDSRTIANRGADSRDRFTQFCAVIYETGLRAAPTDHEDYPSECEGKLHEAPMVPFLLAFCNTQLLATEDRTGVKGEK
jgi:hypothetical protein